MSEEQVDIVCTALQETVIAAAPKLYDKEKPVRAVDRKKTLAFHSLDESKGLARLFP